MNNTSDKICSEDSYQKFVAIIQDEIKKQKNITSEFMVKLNSVRISSAIIENEASDNEPTETSSKQLLISKTRLENDLNIIYQNLLQLTKSLEYLYSDIVL